MLCYNVILLLTCPIILLHVSPFCGLPFPWIKYPKETAYLSASLIGLMQFACLQNIFKSNGKTTIRESFSMGFSLKKRKRNFDANSTTCTSFIRSCFAFILGVTGFHTTAIAFGAELVNKAELTLAWAVSMTTMTLVPTILLLGSHLSTFTRVFLVRDWRSAVEVFCFYLAACVCVASWMFAIPIPLDWDTAWQPWPRTCLFGSYVGYILAMLSFPAAYSRMYKFSFKCNVL